MGSLIDLPEASLDSWYRWLTILTIVLPILGAILGGLCGGAAFIVGSRISNLQTMALNQAKNQLDYLDVSKLNIMGATGTALPPLQEDSSLSMALSPFLQKSDHDLNISCTADALEVFNGIIKNNPNFPFGYFLRGYCKKFLNMDDWKADYERARTILMITTKIPGHHPQHDFVLHRIEKTS